MSRIGIVCSVGFVWVAFGLLGIASAEETADRLPATGKVQFTYGRGGPIRASSKFQQGETVYGLFQITPEAGHTLAGHLTGYCLAHADGETIYCGTGTELNEAASLGLTSFTDTFDVKTAELKPGKYKVLASCFEEASQKTLDVSAEFEVLSPDTFGLRDIVMDRRVFAAGDQFTLEASLRTTTTAHKRLPMKVLTKLIDQQDGDVTSEQELPEKHLTTFTQISNQGQAEIHHITYNIPFHLNRPGRFQLLLTLQHEETKQSAQYVIPLVVVDPLKP